MSEVKIKQACRAVSTPYRHLFFVAPLLLLLILPIFFLSTGSMASSNSNSFNPSIPASQSSFNAPQSYYWPSLRADSISITFSIKERIWSSGTGELDVITRGNGTFSDAKSTTATVTIPEGVSAGVYVCGDDRYSRVVKPCEKWYVSKKFEVYVDNVLVYSLGSEYWWARCYSKAATLSSGTHTVKLVISATVWSYCDSGDGEYYVGQGFLDVFIEGGGSIRAFSHEATAILDGSVTHSFAFRLPEITGVRNMSWNASWKGVSKSGGGTPGSVQRVSFYGLNRDCWSFTTPIVLRVNDPAPSVSASEGYAIDAVYHDGTASVGLHGFAVALNDGDEVGYNSANYLVTDIRRDTKVTGGTLIGSSIWTNSGSTISWEQSMAFYDSTGWVVEKVGGGIETGSATTKTVGGGEFSRTVLYSSKGRTDGLELTVKVPKITIVFTHILISAERRGNMVSVRASWAHDNSPIAGLRVRCFETDQNSVTDLNGLASFTILGSGFEATMYPLDSLNGIKAFERARVRL